MRNWISVGSFLLGLIMASSCRDSQQVLGEDSGPNQDADSGSDSIGSDGGADLQVADDGRFDQDQGQGTDPCIQTSAQLNPRWFIPRIVTEDGSQAIWDYKQRSAIFWFGQVDTRNNYVQVRLGTSDALLMIHCAVFDREIYDDAPDNQNLNDWDSLSLFFDLDGNLDKRTIDSRSFRIDAQAYRHGTQQAAVFQGQGGQWSASALPVGSSPVDTPDRISIERAYRGEERDFSRGWHITFYLPWSSLGLSGPPAGTDQNRWRAALMAYDRDSLDGGLRGAPQAWPGSGFDATDPSGWNLWEFVNHHFLSWSESGSIQGQGQPSYFVSYQPPETQPGTLSTWVIRSGLDGQNVEDACVGASEVLCSGDDEYNFGVGEQTFGGNLDRNYFHVENQEDYADWPCFARIFLRFPLDRLPGNAVVVSARLTLHHAMPTNSGDQGERSLVQAFSVSSRLRDGTTPWTSANINWNNAPLPEENLSGHWGDRTGMMENGWDQLPSWTWDVSRAVARAVSQGDVSFALYSADSEYHTGKQFVRSTDFPDWGDPGQRPTLEIVTAQPR